MTLAPVPSRERMRRFVRDEAMQADGAVLSWVSATEPGYPYPEAAGLVLSWLAQEPGPMSERERLVAAWLVQRTSADGAVGRDDVDYLFDTAMALAGLAARTAERARREPTLSRMLAFVSGCIERASAVGPSCRVDEARWSTRFGPHLLKVAVALAALETREADLALDGLVDRLLSGEVNGLFRGGAPGEPCYLHAACYAAEGLMVMADRGAPWAEGLLESAAEWLAQVQRPDGGLPAFHDGVRMDCAHADATAQAVRIWMRTDGRRYRDRSARALGLLAALQDRSGGVRYREGSSCVNTWATIFTLQALDWFEAGRPTSRII